MSGGIIREAMSSITVYSTPQEFLDATGALLEERELENNLILGICNGFAEKTRIPEGCVFINAFEDGQIRAMSIKTISKAIVAGTTLQPNPIKALAAYYLDNGIQLTGVVGEHFYAAAFSKHYGKRQVSEHTMIVQQLATVNNLPLTTGRMEPAQVGDLDLLAGWVFNFQEDANMFPKQSRAEIYDSTRRRVLEGAYFKWMVEGETVSIAAIVRRTKNIGIVGYVYTPDQCRGKGYATSLVQKLSEYILQQGYRYCGLFTDKANRTSNSIYRKIGYLQVTEFLDIEFK